MNQPWIYMCSPSRSPLPPPSPSHPSGYRTDIWALWEKARVGWSERTALKHVYYQVWNRLPVQVGCMRQVLRAGSLGFPLNFNQCLGSHSEKAMAPHSSTLAWKIPRTEEPGRLQSMGSRRVGHYWPTSLSLFTFMHWRRKWQPTPVFLPGESQGWGRTELDTTEVT